MSVYLIRHGGVENPEGVHYGRLPAFPLSDFGRVQAHATAEFIKRELAFNGTESRVKVVSSPLLRTVQTAALVADALGVGFTTDERLAEIAIPGYQGQPRLHPFEVPVFESQSASMLPLRESSESMGERTYAALMERFDPESHLVIVSHQDVLWSLIARACGMPYESVWGIFPLEPAEAYRLERMPDGTFSHHRAFTPPQLHK